MKTITKLFSNPRTVISSFVAFLLFFAVTSNAQTVVTSLFADNFDLTDTRTELSPGGSPETNYSITRDVLTGTLPTNPYLSTAGMLRVANKKGEGESGRLYVKGELSAFANPFQSKLSEIDADSIVWTFNIRNNSSVSYLGFDDSQRGVATVLTATGPDFNTASGYAFVYYGTSATDTENDPIVRSWRIAKFTNGLYQNANVEPIVERSTSMSTSTTGYYSVLIVYVPSTNTWKLYTRLDSTSGTFKHPIDDTSSYTFVGENVDATHTTTDMTHFGFFLNYIGIGDYIQFYDNYEVRSFKNDVGTSVVLPLSEKNYKATVSNKAVTIEAEKSVAMIYATNGSLVKKVTVEGISSIILESEGLYLLSVVSSDGQLYTEKLIIR